jgi:hypothetical protein
VQAQTVADRVAAVNRLIAGWPTTGPVAH